MAASFSAWMSCSSRRLRSVTSRPERTTPSIFPFSSDKGLKLKRIRRQSPCLWRTHPEDLPPMLALYKDIVDGRQTFASLEVRVRHKQGDWRRIRFNFSPLSDEKGNIEGVFLSGRDGTDLKRREERFIPARKHAALR